MTQFYVGIKIIEAWDQEKDGQQGYAVKYEDGYISWSPKKTFEKAYFPMGFDPSGVNETMVDDFLTGTMAEALDGKTVFVKANLITGFTQYETSSCVDPGNFDMKVGKEICINRIKNKICEYLGFVVQWGRFGLKQDE